MACWEGKKYKLSKSEKFDEYMKEIGVGFVLRKVANSMTPIIELTKDGDEYTLTTCSTFKTTVITFKDGVEFDEETPDGRKIKSVCKFETPEKFVHQMGGEKPTTVVREFTPTKMIATMTLNDVTCIREYDVC